MKIANKIPIVITGLAVTSGVAIGAIMSSETSSAHNAQDETGSSQTENRGQSHKKHHKRHAEHRRHHLEMAAEVLGISTDELKELLQDNRLHEVVEQKGMSLEDFRDQMQNKLEEELTEKGLGQEEISEILERHQKRFERRQENRED